MWLRGEAWSNRDLSQMLLKVELESLDGISGKISPLWGCSGTRAGGMSIPGIVQDVALGDRVWWWTKPKFGVGFRALFQHFMNRIPKKILVQVEITGRDVEAAPGRDGWDQKMRKKGAISWLFVIPWIFAASRFKGGFWTLGFQICSQPESGKFPTRISLNQLYFCWFLKYGAQQVQGTSLH